MPVAGEAPLSSPARNGECGRLQGSAEVDGAAAVRAGADETDDEAAAGDEAEAPPQAALPPAVDPMTVPAAGGSKGGAPVTPATPALEAPVEAAPVAAPAAALGAAPAAALGGGEEESAREQPPPPGSRDSPNGLRRRTTPYIFEATWNFVTRRVAWRHLQRRRGGVPGRETADPYPGAAGAQSQLAALTAQKCCTRRAAELQPAVALRLSGALNAPRGGVAESRLL